MAAKRKKTQKRAKTTGVGSRKLTKSKSDRMISGVMGGIAEYLQIDSTILRLIWIAFVAFTGFIPGILAYAVATVIVPEK